MATKVTKRHGRRNTLSKLVSRQICGGMPFNARFTRSSLLLGTFPQQYCIPLCEIQNGNAFGRGANHVGMAFSRGHILLGFTKSGEYLMSYRVKIEESSYSAIPNHTYILHWWRFNLMRPLEEVCHISLFGGEVFIDELHLIVCHTSSLNQIVIHGISRVGGDDQPKQCFMTLCSSPPCTKCFSSVTMTEHERMCTESSAVHLKYNLLAPFPLFLPTLQLELCGAIILNTVDSLIAVFVNERQDAEPVKQNQDLNVGINEDNLCCSHSSMVVENEKDSQNDQDDVINNSNDDDNKVIDCNEEQIIIHKQPITSCPRLCNLSTYTAKTFCLTDQEIKSSSDETSNVDIKVTNLKNSDYKLIDSVQYNSSEVSTQLKTSCYFQGPCVRTKVVSLDVEKYIDQALNMADQLSGKYWVLRNYSTQLVDISHGSQSVITQVICVIGVQPKITMVTRQRRCSISCLFAWNISNGEVTTLEVSQLMDTMKKTDKKIFDEGRKKIMDLRQKCFVPTGASKIRTFSNHTVFTGISLKFIKHPFQPIAVVL